MYFALRTSIYIEYFDSMDRELCGKYENLHQVLLQYTLQGNMNILQSEDVNQRS